MKIVSLLLLFVPVAVALEHLAPGQHLWVFLVSALAIVPCAGWIGKAPEALAAYLILAIVFYFTPGRTPQ